MQSKSNKKSSDALARVARLFKIISLVSAPSIGHPLGRLELAEACECKVRTVHRDLALLAEAGIPIDYDKPSKTYRLPKNGWSFPVASFTAQDALALSLLRGLVSGGGLPQGEALREILDKLTGSVPAGVTALMQDAVQGVTWGVPVRDYAKAPLLALQEAVRWREALDLDYVSRSRGGERSWRRVDPYGLEAREGRYWELHGWCHRNGAIRTFALDQMQGVQSTGTSFAVREEEWSSFRSALGVVRGIRGETGAEAVPVNVVLVPPVAAYASSQQWPLGLLVSEELSGVVRLTGTVVGTSGLVAELLRWRRYCYVEGGVELRAKMAEEVRAMAALYESDL